jgi:hypothetical protein
MRKSLSVGIAIAMILVGFMAIATPYTADDTPTIEKVISIEGCPCDDTAWLGDTVTITITVWLPAGMTGTVTDDLPDCLHYDGSLKWDVGEGTTVIEFDTIYNDAPGNPEGIWVTNTAYLKVGCDRYSASDCFLAQKYCNFNKYFDFLYDNGDYDGVIEVGENIVWQFTISLYNDMPWAMEGLSIRDNFGAELELDEEPYVSQGEVDVKLKGKSQKVTLFWDVGDLAPGETAYLTVQVSTDLNPAGHQEYTSPGTYQLNSGAVLWFDDPTGLQYSAHTPIVEVTAVCPD